MTMMNFAKAALVLMLALPGFGGPLVHAAPPVQADYEKGGVAFGHLADWKVTGDTVLQESTGARAIDLEGPYDSLVSIMLLPASTDFTLQAFATSVATQRDTILKNSLSAGSLELAKISSGPFEPTQAQVGGSRRSGLVQKYNVVLMGKAVPHEARFFEVRNERFVAFIMAQVATEHAQVVEPGFAAMLSSFRLVPAR